MHCRSSGSSRWRLLYRWFSGRHLVAGWHHGDGFWVCVLSRCPYAPFLNPRKRRTASFSGSDEPGSWPGWYRGLDLRKRNRINEQHAPDQFDGVAFPGNRRRPLFEMPYSEVIGIITSSRWWSSKAPGNPRCRLHRESVLPCRCGGCGNRCGMCAWNGFRTAPLQSTRLNA